MHSLNPEHDEEIHLSTSNVRCDTAVHDREQQMSEERIDKSQDVSGINFSKLHNAGPTQVVIGNTLFRDYTNIRDLLKSVKEELMEIQTDVRLRLYCKTSGIYISASGKTVDVFS
jgi:hypothetical protein